MQLIISILVTTDSTTSEDDSIPPPLPAKSSRESSNDYSNLPSSGISILDNSNGNENYSIVTGRRGHNRPLPAEPTCTTNASYEYVESKNPCLLDDKRRPPTPPPKPSRSNNKYVPA